MTPRSAELPRTAPPALPDTRPLNGIERVRLALEIAAAYARARRELRRSSFESVLATLRCRVAGCTQVPMEEALVQARRLGRAVGRVLRLLPGDTRCLVRSLVLTRLLSRRGIPSTLVIGTRTGPEFLAHAWVECHGHPVLSAGDGSFARLAEL